MADEKPETSDQFLPVEQEGDKVYGIRRTVKEDGSENLTLGMVQQYQEGRPISHELIRLYQNDGSPAYNVKSLYKNPISKGPAKVATPAYRKNFSAVFGGKKKQLPN